MSVFGLVRASLDESLIERVSKRHGNNRNAFFTLLKTMTGITIVNQEIGDLIIEGTWDSLERCHTILYKYQAELCAEELADLADLQNYPILGNSLRTGSNGYLPSSYSTLLSYPHNNNNNNNNLSPELNSNESIKSPFQEEDDACSPISSESNPDASSELEKHKKYVQRSKSLVNFNNSLPSVHKKRRLNQYLIDNKGHPCPFCAVVLGSTMNLKKHVQRKHSTPEHKCDLCGKAYGFVNDLREHKKIHYLNLPCNQCDKTFKSRRSLLGHLSMVHKDSGVPPPPPPNSINIASESDQLEGSNGCTNNCIPNEDECDQAINLSTRVQFRMPLANDCCTV